ncbi:MAG: hypothetical protein RR141_00280 [Rikenellaceae bacterium]
MEGIKALTLASEISKLPDGNFTLVFFAYSRTKRSEVRLRTIKGCKVRKQLPQDAFDIDSDNYFLFTDGDGNPRTCYRILIRFIAFPHDGYKLRNVEWL